MRAEPRFLSSRPNLLVRDIEVSVTFYRELLGFETEATLGDPPNFALLRREGAEIALVLHNDPQPAGCYIYVTGVEDLHQRLEHDGARITYPLTKEPWGLVNFVVQDPDGHGIAIGERIV